MTELDGTGPEPGRVDHDRLEDLLHLSGPRPEPSAVAIDRARRAAHAAWQEELQARRRRWMPLTAIGFGLAAAAALVLAVALGRSRRVDVPPTASAVVARVEALNGAARSNDAMIARGEDIRTEARVRTEQEGRATLRLGNGVELRLDVDTAIRFTSAAVVSLERGAVFVDTGETSAARNAGDVRPRPDATAAGPRTIEIRTAAGIARDVGTAFEVRVTPGAMRVRVRDGVVRLDRDGASLTAERGIELLADPSGVARRAVGLSGPEWNWITLAAAPFDVEGKTLAVFLDWIARESGWTIEFADAALRRSSGPIVLHGIIAGLTPDQALATILPTCGLTHRVAGSRVVVSRASREGGR
jgi:ferric-dicitrate binding protein FerR (iron transport regulator)